MFVIISPSKTQEFKTEINIGNATQPKFISQANILMREMKKYSKDEISSLLGISSKLADGVFNSCNNWENEPLTNITKPAIHAYKGDVYRGLDIENFSEESLVYAQSHLGIVSGLYGILKPLDLIQPYRLDMGIQLSNPSGNNLYKFWGNKILENLKSQMIKNDSKYIINLASKEYYSGALPFLDKKNIKEELSSKVITPIFKDNKNGVYKVISFFAKKARGSMASYIMKNKLSEPTDLLSANIDGYNFNKEQTKNKLSPVFTRN